ncbi:peptide ABC transporter permease [Bordetella genomosp. 10]|uniref:Peptide ABC transporter permease n=1 Tax=Bordetella genomosp. 10 TaxID=1416804 RepID=A0A261SMD6_9BORD|nr:ABC transporter permease [Bordetella genomosp. 10]OZI37940.1 peptide ABC transporter permease [Bordetella genomosp. 10]
MTDPACTLSPAAGRAEASAGAPSRAAQALRGILRRPALLASMLVLALILGWAVAPALFASADPLRGVPRDALQAPSTAHWFGTDHLGRDIYARTVHGTAASLRATSLAVLIALCSGGAIGLSAGFLGGRADAALMRATDVLMAIPTLLLSMAIVTVLGFGTVNVAIAVGLSYIATFARLMRGEVMRWRGATFVEAAIAGGVRTGAVLLRHVLPHAAGPVLALAALEFGAAVLAVSSLSFLGFGAPPPQPEWGLLISEGRNYMAAAWWYTTMPGAVVAAVVLAANQVARAVQEQGDAR